MTEKPNLVLHRFPKLAERAKSAAEATDPNYLKDKWDRLYPGWNLKPDGEWEVVNQWIHPILKCPVRVLTKMVQPL